MPRTTRKVESEEPIWYLSGGEARQGVRRMVRVKTTDSHVDHELVDSDGLVISQYTPFSSTKEGLIEYARENKASTLSHLQEQIRRHQSILSALDKQLESLNEWFKE